MATTTQLTDALRQWRVARSTDDELCWYIAGQAMAAAIDGFLQATAEADRRNLNPSDVLLIKRFPEYPELHQQGMVEIGNQEYIDQQNLRDADFGIQIARDGRVWVCVNGIAFIRFKPNKEQIGN